jgi:hypothetical protein
LQMWRDALEQGARRASRKSTQRAAY